MNGYMGYSQQQRQPIDINQFIQQAAQAKQRGVDPNVVIQRVAQQNPNLNALQQRLTNMAQGRSPREFIIQLARQNGATEQNAQLLAQMLNG